MRQAGQRQHRQAQQLKPGVFVTDTVFDRVVRHTHGRDPPQGLFGAAGIIHHPAGRIYSAIHRRNAIGACRPIGGQTPAIVQDDQQIADHAVSQRVFQLNSVAIGAIAFGTFNNDIAFGAHHAGFPVPADLVRAHAVAIAHHADVAAGDHNVIRAVIFQQIRAKIDIALRIIGASGSRCHRRLSRLRKAGQGGQSHQGGCCQG